MAGGFIKVEIDDRQITKVLGELARAAQDLTPALEDIGDALINSTRARFDSETGPEGQRWAPNSDVTLMRYLQRLGGVGKRRTAGGGRNLTKKGVAALGAKKILRDSGDLADLLRKRVEGNALEVGTDRPYGAMMQFGGTKAKWPHLWGDIPARPFLGLSDSDEAMVLEILRDHLAAPLK